MSHFILNTYLPCTKEVFIEHSYSDFIHILETSSEGIPELQECETKYFDHKFLCQDRKKCILKKFVCDGIKDCLDNSDEPEGCSKLTLTSMNHNVLYQFVLHVFQKSR